MAWILVTFYTGPVGLVMDLLACRRSSPGGHDRDTAATWTPVLNSEMHCLDGDATGIVIAAGIVPAMVLLAHAWPRSDSPAEPAFWFRMSLATIVGGVLAVPLNDWQVARHLKHSCMTLPSADGPAPTLRHSALGMSHGHAGHGAGGHGAGDAEDSPEPTPMAEHECHPMELASPSTATAPLVLVLAGSFAVLLVSLGVVTRWVPIRF